MVLAPATEAGRAGGVLAGGGARRVAPLGRQEKRPTPEGVGDAGDGGGGAKRVRPDEKIGFLIAGNLCSGLIIDRRFRVGREQLEGLIDFI